MEVSVVVYVEAKEVAAAALIELAAVATASVEVAAITAASGASSHRRLRPTGRCQLVSARRFAPGAAPRARLTRRHWTA